MYSSDHAFGLIYVLYTIRMIKSFMLCTMRLFKLFKILCAMCLFSSAYYVPCVCINLHAIYFALVLIYMLCYAFCLINMLHTIVLNCVYINQNVKRHKFDFIYILYITCVWFISMLYALRFV